MYGILRLAEYNRKYFYIYYVAIFQYLLGGNIRNDVDQHCVMRAHVLRCAHVRVIYMILFCSVLPTSNTNLCSISCSGYESALIYCSTITYTHGACGCTEIVGITCSK